MLNEVVDSDKSNRWIRAVGPGEQPFYTIALPDGGGERQTERSRLRAVSVAGTEAGFVEGDDPDKLQHPAAANASAAVAAAFVEGDDPDERQDPAAATVEGDEPDDWDPPVASAAAAAIAAATTAVAAPPNENPIVFFDINIGGLFAGR